MNEAQRQVLIEKVESYAEKVFFFCIKRCNSRIDAEDLSQTILLECIQNINKGTVINNFDYYIWGVCKNQYNMYLKEIIKKRNNVELIEDFDKKDDSTIAIDEIIEEEKIEKMNKAIKLLSKDYVEILYAYYIEDKTLKYISEEMKLPLGTVKRKLFELRRKLKEYLDMEKLNGRKAYIPKNFVGILANESLNFNPHDVTDPLLIKNLLYHSYDNPCSIEDYSIELGISRPYIEDHVNRLVNYDLLKEVDGKYITTIAFIDKKMRRDIYDYLRDNIGEFKDALLKFCKDNLSIYRNLIDENEIKDEHLMWSLLLYTICVIEGQVMSRFTLHEDGTRWDFCLMEELTEIYEDEFFVSYNLNDGSNIKIKAFPSSTKLNKNKVAEIIHWDVAATSRVKSELFSNVTNNRILYSQLDEDYKELADEYIDKNYFRLEDDYLYVNVPVITKDNLLVFEKMIKESKEINDKFLNLHSSIYNKVRSILPSYLHNQIEFITSSCYNTLKSLILSSAYQEGLIKEDNEHKFFVYNMFIVR